MSRANVRLSALQVALLTILLEVEGPMSLDALAKSVHHRAGIIKPRKALRQSIACLIRYTSRQKCKYLGAEIVSHNGVGREKKAIYELIGNHDAIRNCLRWNVNRMR